MPANGRWPYADPRWQPTRLLVLARDGYTCTARGQGPHSHILDVDHIIEAERAPWLAFDLTNLRVLCRRHHNVKTHSTAKRRRRRNTRRW